MATFLERLQQEYTELDEKTRKLDAFIQDNPLFEDLPPAEKQRMQDQRFHMQSYGNILSRRLISAQGDE